MKNDIKVIGTISEINYLTTRNDVTLYRAKIDIIRTSGNIDTLCVVTSGSWEIGDRVSIEGELRSFDDKYSATNKLKTYISPKIARITHEDTSDVNLYQCTGIIVKKPIYCETATGRRLSRFILAVGGERTNYIPCVVWGCDATIDRNVGDSVYISGRYQSRSYRKGGIERTAYEVSVQTITEY